MIAKHRFGSPAAISLVMAGSLALSAPASAQQVHQAEVAGAASVAAQVAEGKSVYEVGCMACHQADGKGLPDAFPPLAGSNYLLKDKDRAVGVVVDGLQGEVVVNDTGYAVHISRLSSSGRYVYTIGRDGKIDLIDLYMAKPAVVAEIKVGLEARSATRRSR